MNQQKLEQERNRLGQTAIPFTEGLEPVRGLTQKHTDLINRISRASRGDNLENRVRSEVDKYKASVRQAKANGLMSPDEPVEVWAFNIDGEMEKEII